LSLLLQALVLHFRLPDRGANRPDMGWVEQVEVAPALLIMGCPVATTVLAVVAVQGSITTLPRAVQDHKAS